MKWQTNNIDEFNSVAKEVLERFLGGSTDNVVLGLVGNLGAGKTTFSKYFANLLGVAEEVTSPTFTIMKIYETKNEKFKELVHIDAYRISDPNEVQKLRIDEYFEKPNTLVLVEWPNNIKQYLPQSTIFVEILHDANDPQKRSISLL